jgi:predicted metallopeptidase
MDFLIDKDIQARVVKILDKIDLPYIDASRIVCFKSHGSKSRAIARIWSLPRIWQLALGKKAHYCIEVISRHFDRLSEDEQIKVLIHELLHIPKNFSGSLLPHRSHWKTGINKRHIEKLFQEYKKG